jgi:hypothetical protein
LGAVEAFGEVRDFTDASSPEFQDAYATRWFPPSENCNPAGYKWMQQHRTLSHSKHHINDARNYIFVHDKVECFERWAALGIPIPAYFTWDPGQFDEARDFDPPFLLRMNNGVAGQDSWLVRGESEIRAALAALEQRYARAGGAVNRMLCTKFIDTRSDAPLNCSYRITVAGGKVVTGYARVSDPADWVAVTNKFHTGIADAWLACNRRCQQIMITHEPLLVGAVEALGLNHQGIDVIQDGATGELYFLEVQTTYDAGFIGAGPYQPPFYNPYNRELVTFIRDNAATLEREIPLYYHLWLDKREHFKACYKNLAEQFKGVGR